MLHTLYAQKLKCVYNCMSIPLIIINTLCGALAASTSSSSFSPGLTRGEVQAPHIACGACAVTPPTFHGPAGPNRPAGMIGVFTYTYMWHACQA